MSNTSNTTVTTKNPFDIFIIGLRKGFNVAINNLMPNVLMAFVLAYILELFGVMAFLGKVCGPVMAIFDLPGQAITVLCATWLSCGAGVGVAASLIASGTLNGHDITIMAPALLLMASQIQYMGRLLGVADVPKKYWPVLMVNSVLMACLG
ncbi:YjiG family protein, partial [uncultured Parasutterella sp.]